MISRYSAIVSICLLVLLVGTVQADTPLRIHPNNPRWFLWRGKATALITSGEHYGAVLNQDFDYIRYLDTLQRDGLNYTRTFTGVYVEPSGAFGIQRNTLAPAQGRLLAPWARSAQPGYTGGGNKFDLERFSPAYFRRWHDFLTAARQRGIVVELTLFSSLYSDKQWAYHPLNPIDYSFTVGKENGTDADNRAPGGGGPALRRQLGVLSRFVHRFDLAKLQPDRAFVRHSPGVVARVLSTKGMAYALYLQGRGPTTLRLNLPPGRWKAIWISVLDGHVLRETTCATSDPVVTLASPDFDSEVALQIIRE